MKIDFRFASLVLLAGAVLWVAKPFAASESAAVIPPPLIDLPAKGSSQTAVFSGGCFWGVQDVFEHVKGVTRVVSGYAGGPADAATYEQVSTGRTGHAESVQITYDPAQVTYGRLLQVFFSVAHDPTQIDRQSPDTGTQYRSVIFTNSSEQASIAGGYIKQLNRQEAFDKAIATEVQPLNGFYPAEAYHQDYATLHPGNPYIFVNDLPKVDALKRLYPALYNDTPVQTGMAP